MYSWLLFSDWLDVLLTFLRKARKLAQVFIFYFSYDFLSYIFIFIWPWFTLITCFIVCWHVYQLLVAFRRNSQFIPVRYEPFTLFILSPHLRYTGFPTSSGTIAFYISGTLHMLLTPTTDSTSFSFWQCPLHASKIIPMDPFLEVFLLPIFWSNSQSPSRSLALFSLIPALWY